MLIITRRFGEIICIGDDIKVAVLGIHGRQVRLGIDAPPEVIVNRDSSCMFCCEKHMIQFLLHEGLSLDLRGCLKCGKTYMVDEAQNERREVEELSMTNVFIIHNIEGIDFSNPDRQGIKKKLSVVKTQRDIHPDIWAIISPLVQQT